MVLTDLIHLLDHQLVAFKFGKKLRKTGQHDEINFLTNAMVELGNVKNTIRVLEKLVSTEMSLTLSTLQNPNSLQDQLTTM